MTKGMTLPLPILILLCASPPPAHADARTEARAWFVKARTDFDEHRHARALEALKQAHSLERLPLLLRYMADCHFELGQYEPAIERYRRYLDRAPEAGDRAQVEQRIAEAERRARAAREQEYAGRKVPTALMPTGKDRENPLRAAMAPPVARRVGDERSLLSIAKWTALGVAVGSLAMGITFNRLAASKANKLTETIRAACPPSSPGCAGNPNLDRPVVSYSLEHYELQRQMRRNNAIAVGSFVVSGVTAATSAVLFYLDRRRQRRKRSRISLAPSLGPRGEPGLAGEVSF